MAKQLTWIFQLIDKMSPDGRKAARAVDDLDRALGRAARSHKDTERAARGAGEGLGMFGLKAFGWIEAIKAVGEVGLEVGKFAAHALSFKEDTLLGLETILGSKKEAQKVMDDAVRFAAATPFSTAQVMDWTKNLVVGGFKPEQANVLLQVAGDFGALKGDDSYVERVILQMTKLNAVGKLTGETMQQLGEAGLPVRKVYEQLATMFGTTVDGVRKLQESGKINSDAGIFAIVKAMEGLAGGKVGNVLEKRSQSLSGLWSTLTSRPEELIMATDSTGAMGAVKGAIAKLGELLDPASESGQKIVQVIGAIIDGVVAVGQGLGETISWIAGFFDAFAFGFGELEGGRDFLRGLGIVLSWVGHLIGDVLTASFIGFGMVARFVWDGFQQLGDDLARVAFGIWYAWDWVTTKLSAAWKWLSELGSQLMRGLADGITGGIQWVVDAVTGVADTVVSKFKGLLGIHSPSRVFEGLGLNVTAGFEQGVDAGAGRAQAAVEGMVSAPQVAGGGRGGGVTIAPGAIVINVPAGTSEDLAERVREAVLQALGGAFEQLGMEVGAS